MHKVVVLLGVWVAVGSGLHQPPEAKAKVPSGKAISAPKRIDSSLEQRVAVLDERLSARFAATRTANELYLYGNYGPSGMRVPAIPGIRSGFKTYQNSLAESAKQQREFFKKRLTKLLEHEQTLMDYFGADSPSTKGVLRQAQDHLARLNQYQQTPASPSPPGSLLPLANVGLAHLGARHFRLLLPGQYSPTRINTYAMWDVKANEIGRPPAGRRAFVILHEHPEWVLLGGADHYPLTLGRPVAYAGEVAFDDDGHMLWWNNGTGHYKAHPGLVHQAAFPTVPGVDLPLLPLHSFRPMHLPAVLQKRMSAVDQSWPASKLHQLEEIVDRLGIRSKESAPDYVNIAKTLSRRWRGDNVYTPGMVHDKMVDLGLVDA